MVLDIHELRERARREAEELGSEPADRQEHWAWLEERRGATALLASLTDWDVALLSRAAIDLVDGPIDPLARELLLEAADGLK